MTEQTTRRELAERFGLPLVVLGTTAAAAQSTLSEKLNWTIGPLHRDALRIPFSQSFSNGTITADAYITDLQQRYHIHKVMEDLLQAQESNETIAGVYTPHQVRTPYLLHDLAVLQLAESPDTGQPTTETQELVDYLHSVAATKPAALLGALYVFEGGIRFGGQILAAAVENSPNLDSAAKTYHKGTDQNTQFFEDYVQGLDHIVDPILHEGIMDAAKETFRLFLEMEKKIDVPEGNVQYHGWPTIRHHIRNITSALQPT